MMSKIWSMGLVVLVASGLCLIFIVAATSLGIFLATVARTMPQFALLMILVLLPLQMLSGGATPRESMPEFVQQIMTAAPTTHFVKLAQGIIYRGGSIGCRLAAIPGARPDRRGSLRRRPDAIPARPSARWREFL
jgi:ABC-2 type transport system permease protein